MTIRLLDQSTIGKIAAGEVVERPASVVKEILENALDAGADRIQVRIEGGGTDLIEVSDNGKGMSAEELSIAIERYATSKLSQFEDLDELHTLGFRGEALPSIGAVSRMQLRSNQANNGSGHLLALEFGEIGQTEAVGSAVGTTVIVRDLFANVPARRKFLKSPQTESAYAARVVENYALAYPNVSIGLTLDGRRYFATSGDGNVVNAAAAVFGPGVGSQVIEVPELRGDLAVEGVGVTGWVSQPSLNRSHRQQIVFFVNGRWVQSRALSFALEDAYHTLIMIGRHPVSCLSVTLDPRDVDVNIHPSKAQVKFRDERQVARGIRRATHAALSGNTSFEPPSLTFGQPSPIPFPPPGRPAWPLIQQPTAKPEKETQPEITQIIRQMPMLRVLGQVASTYIIAEGPEGLYLIDQHAAHERIVFERIMKNATGQQVERQPLLDPVVVELSPEELAMLDRSSDELASIGFDLEGFGAGAVAVRAVPAVATGSDLSGVLHNLLGELIDGGSGGSWLESVAISAACHTSIRAGKTMTLAEMKELIEQLERTDNPRACGHGRPTMLKLSQSDLERQFARK